MWNHLKVLSCHIKNKEVIIPSLSFVSTANAVIENGGIPKFVDIDEKTLCMDPEKIEKVIGFKAKRGIKDAVADLKQAFEEGKLPNSMENKKYFNIKSCLVYFLQ